MDETSDSENEDLLVGQLLDDRYEIKKSLDSGGMGTVYLAWDSKLERLVVVKIPHARLMTDRTFRQRFLQEIRDLANHEHPAILRIEGSGSHGDVRPVNAFLPIIVLVISLLVGMYVTGEGESLRDIIGSSDPYMAMLWASTLAVLVAAALSIGQRILSTHETVDAWYGGARATLFGMIVLVLAWSMSDVTAALNAKEYLISILGDTLPLELVPAVVFVLAAVTAFSTGTSWGTMGILLPLVLPLAWAVMTVSGVADASGMHIMNSSIACVLAGAVWGDHCSPISDTTVLSSIASGCDHIEHVRTQMPYALLVGAVAVAVGTIPAGYGMSPWISIIAGAAILVGVLRYLGRKA